MRHTTAHGFGTTLDPDRIYVTTHAIARYRDHRSTTVVDAEERLRDLMRRIPSGKRPPVKLQGNGNLTRKYTNGGFQFITSADHTVLITFYAADRNGRAAAKRKAKHRRPKDNRP